MMKSSWHAVHLKISIACKEKSIEKSAWKEEILSK